MDEDEDPAEGQTPPLDVSTAPAASGEAPAAGAPQSGESVAPVEPAAPAGADSFDWETWDGTTYDPFPEPVRPWLKTLHARTTTQTKAQVERATAESKAAEERWKRMYLEDSREEDPRLAELTTTSQQHLTELEAARTQLAEANRRAETTAAEAAKREKDYEEYAARSATRYSAWFKEAYAERLDAPGGVEAAQGMSALLDIEPPDGKEAIEPHQAFEIALAGGKEAVEQATQMLGSGVAPEVVHKVLMKAYGEASKPQKVQPREAASLVEDGTHAAGSPPPTSRRPRSTGNAIDDGIMAAVDAALRR